jgi:hypothetical protein
MEDERLDRFFWGDGELTDDDGNESPEDEEAE